MNYPEGYVRYVKSLRLRGMKPDSRIAKFAARYQFAGQLNSIELFGYNQNTVEIYTVVLRLCLSYSALEQLESLLKRVNLPIRSEHLSRSIKSAKLSKLRDFLIVESDKKLNAELSKFFRSRNDFNLNPVVRAIRHSMFHGNLNANRSGISTKTAFQFIAGLDQLLFKSMDDKFGEYINSLEM